MWGAAAASDSHLRIAGSLSKPLLLPLQCPRSNVLLDAHNRACLGDLGLSQYLQTARTHTVLGASTLYAGRSRPLAKWHVRPEAPHFRSLPYLPTGDLAIPGAN